MPYSGAAPALTAHSPEASTYAKITQIDLYDVYFSSSCLLVIRIHGDSTFLGQACSITDISNLFVFVFES